jgi:peptidoglycan/xylan/chitin deacetylase (PgdA/CDA1 family)
VTAEIHRLPIEHETAGIAAGGASAFHHRDAKTATGQLPCRAKSRRAATQNHNRPAIHCYIGHSDPLSLRTVILTYHSIDESGSVISVSPSQFRRHMEIPVVPLSAVRATPGAVALTFDDGYRNFLEVAVPDLLRYRFPATVFVVNGYCGLDNNWPTQPPFAPRLPLMSWRELEQVAAQGITLGAHSVTHPFLTRLPAERIRAELSDCRQTIETRLDVVCEGLAYPYGDSDARVREVASEVFRFACGTRPDFLSPSADPFNLPRIDAYYVRDPRRFQLLFSPAGRPYIALRRWARGLKALSPGVEPAPKRG